MAWKSGKAPGYRPRSASSAGNRPSVCHRPAEAACSPPGSVGTASNQRRPPGLCLSLASEDKSIDPGLQRANLPDTPSGALLDSTAKRQPLIIETRRPKSEGRKKAEVRNPKSEKPALAPLQSLIEPLPAGSQATARGWSRFAFRVSDFGLRVSGLRASGLWLAEMVIPTRAPPSVPASTLRFPTPCDSRGEQTPLLQGHSWPAWLVRPIRPCGRRAARRSPAG